jgi:hypothetical protein
MLPFFGSPHSPDAPRTSRRPARKTRKATLSVEELEDRRLLSTTSTISPDTLQLIRQLLQEIFAAVPGLMSCDTGSHSSGSTSSGSSGTGSTTSQGMHTTGSSGGTTTSSGGTTTSSGGTTTSTGGTTTSSGGTTTSSGGTTTSSGGTTTSTGGTTTSSGGKTTSTGGTTTSSGGTTTSTGGTTTSSGGTTTSTGGTTTSSGGTTTSSSGGTTTVSTQGNSDGCPTISGFVYHDANNNGIKDANEVGIAGSNVQLLNSHGTVVATATTDANGAYTFATDSTISTNGQTQMQTLHFANGTTNWTTTQQATKFDSSLGTLSSIDITNNGAISSHIRVENLDQAAATINAQASGTLALTGAGLSTPLTTTLLSPSSSGQSFQAQAYDGMTDYSGASGHDFGTRTASGSQSVHITDAATLAQFTGTGSVNLTETANATSSASGNGNLQTLINSTAGADVTIVYHYTADNCLKPGTYVIHLTQTPTGYIAGQETAGNVTPLPAPIGSNSIPVSLGTTNSTNNNFGELRAASLSGFVYADANNNGVKDTSEAGISGSAISLSGTDDQGSTVSLSTTTDANGAYQFANLRPGSYTLKQDEPSGFMDGKDTIGSQGGTAANDQMTGITLASGTNGANNNFGEIPTASVSGSVYVDVNNSGVKVAGDPPIANVAIALSGTDDQGNTVALNTTTDTTGFYQFINLRPGSYTITETQPANFQQGHNNIGSLGGTVNGDQFLLNVNAGDHGMNYNFGEIAPKVATTQGTPDQTTQAVPDGVVTKRDSLMLFYQRRGFQMDVNSM